MKPQFFTVCPHCGVTHDATTVIGRDDSAPKVSDVNICSDCMGVSVFDENMKAVLPPEPLRSFLEDHPAIMFAREAIKKAKVRVAMQKLARQEPQ